LLKEIKKRNGIWKKAGAVGKFSPIHCQNAAL
jgi:hypothetical protein